MSSVKNNTMDEIEKVFTRLYDALVQLQYPEIAMAEPHNMHDTIFFKENRIQLLSWLLSKKSVNVELELEKKSGKILTDYIVKYYSDIGICKNADILLGNCKLKEQLPMLSLLLNFIQNVHLISDIKNDKSEYLQEASLYTDDLSKVYQDIKLKLNKAQALQYFNDIENNLQEQENIENNETVSQFMKLLKTKDSLEDENGEIHEVTYCKQKEKLLETYNISLLMTNVTTNERTYMDDIVGKMHSNFFAFEKILQSGCGISNLPLPTKLEKVETPLNSVIEDTIIRMETFARNNDPV